MTIIVYIQNNISWALGFGIPAAAMVLAIVLFVAGSPRYTHVEPTERCALSFFFLPELHRPCSLFKEQSSTFAVSLGTPCSMVGECLVAVRDACGGAGYAASLCLDEETKWTTLHCLAHCMWLQDGHLARFGAIRPVCGQWEAAHPPRGTLSRANKG